MLVEQGQRKEHLAEEMTNIVHEIWKHERCVQLETNIKKCEKKYMCFGNPLKF